MEGHPRVLESEISIKSGIAPPNAGDGGILSAEGSRAAAMGDSAYSFSLTTFSPSGKLVQIEYALNAVASGSTSLGVKAKNGVVIATEKKLPTCLIDETSMQKVMMLTENIAVVYSGMGPDYRVLCRKGRKAAQAYYRIYREVIPVTMLVRELAAVMQEFTQRGGVRPFGISLLLAGFDHNGPQLFQIDPSGSYFAWKASAIGKHMVNAKVRTENLSPLSRPALGLLITRARTAHGACSLIVAPTPHSTPTSSAPRTTDTHRRQISTSVALPSSPPPMFTHTLLQTFLEKRYNDELELEDAVHTALLTLKEGFEGAMDHTNIEASCALTCSRSGSGIDGWLRGRATFSTHALALRGCARESPLWLAPCNALKPPTPTTTACCLTPSECLQTRPHRYRTTHRWALSRPTKSSKS